MNKSIQIICPVFNEVQNIENFYSEFSNITEAVSQKYAVSFLFLDNASTDGTFEKLTQMCVLSSNIKVLRYSRNYGAMKSIFTGLINSTGDAVAVFDCDLQDPPELILKFIKAWESGAKVSFGIRAKRVEGTFMTLSRKSFRKIEAFFKGYKSELESGAWFLDKRVVEELSKRSFEPFLAGLIGRLGFMTQGIPYERASRRLGTSKFNLGSYFSYAMDGLVSGTIAPLRVAILMGCVLSLLSLLAAIYFCVAKFYLGMPFASGVAAIIIISLFSFSINFIFLGIIGEYVGRIYLSRELSEPAIVEFSIGQNNKN
jgi:glycosyltransferase involved in cell wall biosynthesis